ncbi:hypothetical protein [Mycobacterium intracellulare]|uniref:hypothetical protein n=1 Tax=Mycobacterium intracellulare TaxID=1767 RepID=UPI0013E089BF|nr:hypothetical protein [Mycobacterium intracellulare]
MPPPMPLDDPGIAPASLTGIAAANTGIGRHWSASFDAKTCDDMRIDQCRPPMPVLITSNVEV